MSEISKQDQAAGLKGREASGRFIAKYDRAVALRVLEQVAEGRTLAEVTRQEGMPHRQTFYRWLLLDPELERAYTAARELSALSLEEEAIDMARTLKAPNDFTGTKVRAFEVAMSQFRWSAARRDPKRYGQQQAPSLVVPIQINTTLDLANGGTSSIENIYTLSAKVPEARPEEVMPEDAVEPDSDDEGEIIDNTEGQDIFGLPDKGDLGILTPPKKPIGRPKGIPYRHPKHKTKAATGATMANYAKRKTNPGPAPKKEP